MKAILSATILTIVTIIFWAAETATNGWNLFPATYDERVCDGIVRTGFYIAFFLLIWPGLKKYLLWLKEQE